jgi:hypothetical protein
MNLRDKILAARDIPSETITVSEWDVDLLIKGMTAGERVTLMQNAYDPRTEQVNMSKVYPDVVVACAHDPETGEPVFSDSDKDAILGKASAAIEKIADVGLRLSGIGKEAQDAAGKDSSSTPSDDTSLS